MKTHLYTKGRVACGELPDHSPMIRDPAAVDANAVAKRLFSTGYKMRNKTGCKTGTKNTTLNNKDYSTMPRKSKYKTVTVFESFVVAAETLKSDDEKGKLYSAIMRYSLYGEEPELDGICSALFELMKPNIDKSNCRRDARSREQTGEQTGNKPGNKNGEVFRFCHP